MPFPHSLRGAGLAEVAQAVRLPGRRVHLAVRRCRQRPSMDRWALDFRQCSFRHVTRVSPSNSFSVFSPFSALSAGSCPLALSGSGKPLAQGSPLNPSHLRWGCCMNYCGAPDAGGSQVQRQTVSKVDFSKMRFWRSVRCRRCERVYSEWESLVFYALAQQPCHTIIFLARRPA
jgi:hypothetical protein